MPTPILLLIAAGFWGLTYLVLRGGWRQPGRLRIPELTGGAMLAAILSIAAAIYFLGPLGGLALIVSIVVHEFGHVAAYRVCGHDDARFRLVPLFGGVAISNQLPASQGKDFYITAMGPGICLALMISAMALAKLTQSISIEVSLFFTMLMSLTAMLNFFNLLPLWPLDGGRMLRIVAYAFSPALAQVITLAMSATLVAIGISMQWMLLTVFALLSAGSAFNAPLLSSMQRPVTRGQAILCLAIHVTMAAAFLLAGKGLLLRYL